MTRRILRYRLRRTAEAQTVNAPAGPVIDVELVALGVGPTPPILLDVWIEADDGPELARTFQVVGTGSPLPAQAVHVGSAARHDGFKWHIYEVQEGKGA